MITNAVEKIDCYVALELSRAKWVIGSLMPGSKKVVSTTINGGDATALVDRLGKIRSTAAMTAGTDVNLRVCFESGYDGFWLARFLLARGIDTLVLDPTSFLVSRRGRRVKTDRVDVEAMVFTLKAYLLGDHSVCRPVRLPTPEEEDAKRLTREWTHLRKERTRHVNRIRALLTLHGIRHVRGLWGGERHNWLARVTTGDGRPLGRFLAREIDRQFERLELLQKQIKDVQGERQHIVQTGADIPSGEKIATLKQLSGVGDIGATLLVTEVFHRTFKNRRHLASYLGLAPSPYASGDMQRDQGISKAGNKAARVLLVELAWCWLRYQPNSALAQWYRTAFANNGGRSRKLGIVALARKLAIALWRFVETGVVPDGACLRQS